MALELLSGKAGRIFVNYGSVIQIHDKIFTNFVSGIPIHELEYMNLCSGMAPRSVKTVELVEFKWFV